MTTRTTPRSLPPSIWALGAAVGVVAGLAVLVPVGYVAAAGVAALVAVVVVRSRARSELIVGAYWLTFCVFSTMLADYVPAGMFYPFYVALILGAVVALAVDRLTFHPFVAWTYVVLLVILVRSLVGFEQSLGGDTLDRLIVVPFGALVMLQFRSARGVRPVAIAAILASLAVSVWVIASAVQGGFAYRGNIDVNENVVSFYVALGFVAAFAERLHRRPLAGPWGRVLGIAVLVALATMAYALVLLASRGMIIGVSLALLAMAVRIALRDRRRLIAFAALFALVPLGLLLPGGRGIVERFENPSTATGGGRTQIWAAIGTSLAQAEATELALGHGFGASSELVQQNFTSLRSTHNAYLQVLYDLGISGLLLFLGLHAYAFVRSWSVPGASGALMLGLVTFLLGANLFMSTPDNFLYWTALGFVLAIGTWARDGGAPSAPTP